MNVGKNGDQAENSASIVVQCLDLAVSIWGCSVINVGKNSDQAENSEMIAGKIGVQAVRNAMAVRRKNSTFQVTTLYKIRQLF